MLSAALAPLLLAIALIASRRVSTLMAGCIGWAAALVGGIGVDAQIYKRA